MKTRRFLLSAITTAMMAVAIGQRAMAQTLQVHQANGATTDLVLGTETTVKFLDECVRIASTSQTRDFAKADVLRFTYTILRHDVNGDGKVDVADIASVIDAMAGSGSSVGAGNGVGAGPVPARTEADVNGDGVVDVADIASVIDKMTELARRANMPRKAEAANGNIGEAFYIYRNDGQFNAFFRDEIDSIGFSHYTADSLRYNKIASQVVYTPDSTYMIPLVAIDSVGFVQPEDEYKPGVMRMDESWLPYVIGITDYTITFRSTTPSSFLPSQGQVVVAETFESPFETGFSGRVTGRTNYTDSIVYSVEGVGLPDIYEHLVTMGISASETEDGDVPSSRRKIWGYNYDHGIRFPLPNVDVAIGPVTLSCVPDVVLKYIVCVGEPNLKNYVDIRVVHKYQGSVKLDCKFDADYKPEPKWTKGFIPITTGVPGLYGKIMFGGFVRASGSVQLSATQPFTISGVEGFVYSDDDGFRPLHDWHATMQDTEISLSLDGSVSAGLAIRLQFGVIHERIASADLTAYIGPKFSGHIGLSSAGIIDKTLYSAIKDSEITLSLGAEIVPGYRWVAQKLIGQVPKSDEHQELPVSLDFSYQLNHWYAVPLFDNLGWKGQGVSGDLSGDISRNLLPKVSLGWGFYDVDDNLYKSEYFPQTYRKLEDWPQKGLEHHVEGLKDNTYYKAYPMVKLLGVEMRADKYVEIFAKEFPVTISDFKVTKSQYQKGAFINDGKKYDYRFDVSVTASIESLQGVRDWGYVYRDPNGQEKEISLISHGTSYTDTNYAYFRNETPSTCTLYGYVKYVGVDEPVYGEPQDYPLEHKGETSCPDENHPHWIDLGIGTEWRCCNEGASRPEEYGGYYTFGQVASAPTLEQIKALVNNCSYTWTTQNGVNGGKFTGPNGGTIFLPAAGEVWYGELDYVGSRGIYWSSTPLDEDSAYYLYFPSGSAYCHLSWYYYFWANNYINQLSVRPVR